MSAPRVLDLDLLARQAASVRALARALVRDELEAEDLAQESLVLAMKKPPRDAESLRAWLATVVRRLVLDRRRSDSRRKAREELVARPESQESHAVAVERLELEHRVLEEVLALREPYRTAVYLRFWEELEPAAIAERLDAPVKTIRSRLSRALEDLRRKLDAQSGGDRERWLPALAAVAFPRGSAGVKIAAGVGLMKQAAVVVGALALLWFAWWGIRAGSGGGTRESGASEPVASIPSASEPQRRIAAAIPLDADTPSARRSSSADSARSCSLSARFTYQDGNPAADVSIDVRCDADPAPREEFFRGRTDREGRVRFDELWPGKVKLYPDRGQYFDVQLAIGEQREADFVLPEGIIVEGLVTGSDETPIADATVLLEGVHWSSPRPHASVRSDAQGRFRLEGLSANAQVAVRARGFKPSVELGVSTLPSNAAGARVVVFRLDAGGGEVEGRVVDPDGRPVGSARVKVGYFGGSSVDLRDGRRGVSAQPVAVETDSDGRFQYLGNLHEGTQPVTVAARGWPTWSGTIEVRSGQVARVDATLRPPARIEGRVLDGAGRPVEHVSVVDSKESGGGWHSDPFPPPRATTDAEGRFVLDWVAEGERELHAVVPEKPELGRAQRSVPCTPGETTTADLVLDPGLTITGRVVTANGNAVVKWTVNADPQPYGRVYPRQTKTDDQGRFTLANLDPDHVYNLSARPLADVSMQAPAKKDRVAPGAREVEIVADADPLDSRLRGRIVGLDGGVPTDVNVACNLEGSDRDDFIPFDKSSGAFESSPMRAGRYSIFLVRGSMTISEIQKIDLGRGETRDVGTLVPQVPGRVEIVLKGIPAEELNQLTGFLERSGHSTEVLAPASGVLSSRAIAPGEWRMSLSPPWLVRRTVVEVRSNETSKYEFEAERGVHVSVHGTLADSTAPWEELTLSAENDAHEVLEASMPWRRNSLPKESLDLWGLLLPTGHWTLRLSTDTGLSGTQSVDVVSSDGGSQIAEIVVK